MVVYKNWEGGGVLVIMGMNVHNTYQGGSEIEKVTLIVEPMDCSFKPNQPLFQWT